MVYCHFLLCTDLISAVSRIHRSSPRAYVGDPAERVDRKSHQAVPTQARFQGEETPATTAGVVSAVPVR